MRSLSAAVLLLISASSHAELPSATDAIIRQALGSGKPVVIDVGAHSCMPCRKMAPILESLSNEYKGRASVLFIDAHEDEAAAGKFSVMLIPTQIFFDAKGNEVKRHYGFMDKPEIVQELKALGVKSSQ